MKLIVVLSIVEYQEEVAALLHRAGIKRFSTTRISAVPSRYMHLSLM